MRGDSGERIDRLIDRAAASMTEAETSSAFVARVMTALDNAAPPVRRAWRPGLVPATACALVVAVLGGWWTSTRRPLTDASTTQLLVSRSLPTTSVAVALASVPAPAPTHATTASTPWGSRRDARMPARVPVFPSIAIDEVEIAPVAAAGDTLAPLPVEALPLIAVDEIALEPIDVARPHRSDPPQSPGGRR